MPSRLLHPNSPARGERTAALLAAGAIIVLGAATLAACAGKPTQDQIEAANNTFICQAQGERIVIRFDTGEARMLMPSGERVALYQIATASGVRFMNSQLELRGKGTELTLVRDGMAIPLDGCHNPTLPQQ